MKKSIYIFILFINSFLIKAQEQTQLTKGHFFVGGGFDFEYAKHNDGLKNISVEISPNAAIFLTNNLAAGLKFNSTTSIAKGTSLSGNSFTERQEIFSVTPFVRYYVFSYFFYEGEVGYQRYWYNTDHTNKTKFWGLKGSVNMGYSLFINEHIAIEPIISYAFESIKNINEDPYDRKTNILDFSVRINSFF